MREMDKLSYEGRRKDEQRRFVRFTFSDKIFVYVDRYAIRAFGQDAEGNAYINVGGVSNRVQESVSEIMTALGMR
jgi:hypothetical protein